MQTKDLVLGLDVGTGSAKCVVASPDGHAFVVRERKLRMAAATARLGRAGSGRVVEWGTSAIRQVLGEHPEARDRICSHLGVRPRRGGCCCRSQKQARTSCNPLARFTVRATIA